MSTDNTLRNSGLTSNEILLIQKILKQYPEIEEAILYGSRAKGTHKTGSDIDLTLITKSKNLTLLFKIENDIDDLLLPYKVDLSFFSLLDNENLKEHITRVGVLFYKK